MSSGSSVATISMKMITIVGAGTVNVTATQAETANFTSGTITTTFTVNKATTTLGNLIIPNKTFGDSSFNIVDPSSNRAGSFTYTSSNPSVATISGNTISIVGGGNSIITATQGSVANYNSASKTTTFRVKQRPPIITGIDPGMSSVLIHFHANNNSGLEILHYRYAMGTNEPIITNFTQSPILITGLVLDVVYSVSILSFTSEGLSDRSNSFVFKAGTPNSPIINSIAVSNTNATFTINYTQSSITNGSAITKMLYTFDGRSFLPLPTITNPIIIPNIARGKLFNVQIVSQNARGNSPLSNSVTGLVPAPPSKLTINSAAVFLESATTCYAVVNIKTPDNGGSQIITYKYALDKSNVFIDLSNNSLPIVIPNLPVNQIFTIKLIATNLLGGDSPVSSSSKPLRYILLPPAPPVIKNVTTSLNNMLVNFPIPRINGSQITTYRYSLNNGPFIDISSNVLPFNVPILNNTQYNIRVRAVNLGGESLPSTPLVRPVMFTYLPPLAPKINSITGSNQSLIVNFTGSTFRGAPVTSYSYSLDFSSNIIDTGITTSPLTISGLTNGTSYSVVIYANSLAGISAVSNRLSGTPILAAPGIPVIASITPLNNSCSIELGPPVINGSPIITYFYSLDNGITFINTNSSSSPLLISGLVNGTLYNIRIRAVNGVGNSPLSLARPVAPIYAVPTAPRITRITTGIVAGIRRMTIAFTASVPNGSPIKAYHYSFDNGVTLVNANRLITPITITGLTQFTTYAVMLYAENDVGISAASNIIIVNVN